MYLEDDGQRIIWAKMEEAAEEMYGGGGYYEGWPKNNIALAQFLDAVVTAFTDNWEGKSATSSNSFFVKDCMKYLACSTKVLFGYDRHEKVHLEKGDHQKDYHAFSRAFGYFVCVLKDCIQAECFSVDREDDVLVGCYPVPKEFVAWALKELRE